MCPARSLFLTIASRIWAFLSKISVSKFRYAGPEFQSVTDVWTRGWATTHMVSDKNIVVASVDGRGSAYEGGVIVALLVNANLFT